MPINRLVKKKKYVGVVCFFFNVAFTACGSFVWFVSKQSVLFTIWYQSQWRM